MQSNSRADFPELHRFPCFFNKLPRSSNTFFSCLGLGRLFCEFGKKQIQNEPNPGMLYRFINLAIRLVMEIHSQHLVTRHRPHSALTPAHCHQPTLFWAFIWWKRSTFCLPWGTTISSTKRQPSTTTKATKPLPQASTKSRYQANSNSCHMLNIYSISECLPDSLLTSKWLQMVHNAKIAKSNRHIILYSRG